MFNLFQNILTPKAQSDFSAIWDYVSNAFKPVSNTWTNIQKEAEKVFTPKVENVKQSFNQLVEPYKQPVTQYQNLGKINTFLSDKWITVDHIRELAKMDWTDAEEALNTIKSMWIRVKWMEEQKNVQEKPINTNQDWYNNKSYFWDQRSNEWITEQTWKWIIRTPITFAQNVISWPENIAQWWLNFLEQTIWEWILNPTLNVIWWAIKWDKYSPLPTWYNNVPSKNQFTENVVSNILGAWKEALTTWKTYSQANEELKQQQYQAGKNQWIGGSLANIAGGWVSTAFNIMSPWASSLFALTSEMPWTQYLTQWLGAITQAPIDYVVNKAWWTQETAEQLGNVTNLALPLGRNKIAGMKTTSTSWKTLQKIALTTADTISNPLWIVKDIGIKVFSKNPRPVDEIAGNILQPYKWMTENLYDATNWLRRVVEETWTKTSTFDWLLKNIIDTQNKYWKMLSDSLGQVRTETRSPLFDMALTQLAKIYEWVSSSEMKTVQNRITELGKKNFTTGLTPLEKNEVKILHTKANNLFNEKWKETGWFSSDDLRGMRRDMVNEINKDASEWWVTNIADINKVYWELSDARTLAENQVANLKSYKGRTPPPTTMAKITSMIVDFPIIKQAFSDPTRAIASALFKNLRWDKINPIEVQSRLSWFLKELKYAWATSWELKKIGQIMVSIKLLPAPSWKPLSSKVINLNVSTWTPNEKAFTTKVWKKPWTTNKKIIASWILPNKIKLLPSPTTNSQLETIIGNMSQWEVIEKSKKEIKNAIKKKTIVKPSNKKTIKQPKK